MKLAKLYPLGAVLCSLAHAALAQPAEQADPDKVERDRAAFYALRKQLEPKEKSDPATVVAEYRKFLQKPGLTTAAAMLTGERLMQVMYFRQKDAKGALELGEGLMKNFGPNPDAVRINTAIGRILVASGHADEAATRFKDKWRDIPADASPWDYTGQLGVYTEALGKQNKFGEVAETLKTVMQERPLLLDPADTGMSEGAGTWFYEKLIDTLSELGRHDEALGVAKYQYVLCSYDAPAIQQSVRLLKRAWTAQTMTDKTVQAFDKAQADAKMANPLADVKFAGFDLPTIERSLPAVTTPGWTERAAITQLILNGSLRDAMSTARRALLDHPNDPKRALGVCRVFKAGDLNTMRAEAFLAAYNKPDGAGREAAGKMMDRFMQEAAEREKVAKVE